MVQALLTHKSLSVPYVMFEFYCCWIYVKIEFNCCDVTHIWLSTHLLYIIKHTNPLLSFSPPQPINTFYMPNTLLCLGITRLLLYQTADTALSNLDQLDGTVNIAACLSIPLLLYVLSFSLSLSMMQFILNSLPCSVYIQLFPFFSHYNLHLYIMGELTQIL